MPGYVISGFLKFRDDEKFLVSFGFSVLFYLSMLPLVLSGLDVIVYVILFIFMILFIINIKTLQNRFLIKLFIFQIVLYSILSFMLPYPVLGGDWYIHSYIQPKIFESGDWSPPVDRPPVFSMLVLSFHKLFSVPLEQFWFSQMISIIFNGLMWLPLFFIAKNYVHKKNIAKLSAILVMILPFIAANALYTWPKALAGYFILLAVYFLFSRKPHILAAGLFSAMAFLLHNYTVFFILAIFLLLLIRKHYKKALIFMIITFLIIAPYILWYFTYYHSVSKSNFAYYPFAVDGYGKINENTMKKFYNTPITTIIGNRIANTILTFTPVVPVLPLFHDIGILNISQGTYNWAPWLHIYHTYIGALTLGVYVIAVLWFLHYLKNRNKHDDTLVFIILSAFIFSAILWGWYELGLVHQTLQPTIPIILMLGIVWLSHKKYFSKAIWIVLIVILIELAFYMIGSYNYFVLEDEPTLELSVQRFLPEFRIENLISSFSFVEASIILIAIHIIALILICFKMFKSEF